MQINKLPARFGIAVYWQAWNATKPRWGSFWVLGIVNYLLWMPLGYIPYLSVVTAAIYLLLGPGLMLIYRAYFETGEIAWEKNLSALSDAVLLQRLFPYFLFSAATELAWYLQGRFWEKTGLPQSMQSATILLEFAVVASFTSFSVPLISLRGASFGESVSLTLRAFSKNWAVFLASLLLLFFLISLVLILAIISFLLFSAALEKQFLPLFAASGIFGLFSLALLIGAFPMLLYSPYLLYEEIFREPGRGPGGGFGIEAGLSQHKARQCK